jgi:Ca2+-binding EF-hand superfamily protein
MMRHFFTTAAVALAMTAIGMPAGGQQQQQGQCAREFSAVDSNGDSKVTQQEASSAVSGEFNRIDMDGNGTISKSEWQNCGWHTMLNTKRSNMQAADHAPMKKDSQSASQSGGQSASTTTLDEKAPPQPWTTNEQFSKADANNDGMVSREEAAKATESAYGQAAGDDPGKEQLARQSGARFAMIDSNGDGAISQQEWQNRNKADIQTLFARLDQNNNDKLSKSEYQNVRDIGQPAGEPMTIWYYHVY